MQNAVIYPVNILKTYDTLKAVKYKLSINKFWTVTLVNSLKNIATCVSYIEYVLITRIDRAFLYTTLLSNNERTVVLN